MRSRPQILMDLLDGALSALGLRAAEERKYEEFVISLQEQGAYAAYVESSDRLERRQQGLPCPGCNDQPGVPCELCGFDDWRRPPPGWYGDPELDGYARYWTGQQWAGNPVEITWDSDLEVNGTYEPAGWNN